MDGLRPGRNAREWQRVEFMRRNTAAPEWESINPSSGSGKVSDSEGGAQWVLKGRRRRAPCRDSVEGKTVPGPATGQRCAHLPPPSQCQRPANLWRENWKRSLSASQQGRPRQGQPGSGRATLGRPMAAGGLLAVVGGDRGPPLASCWARQPCDGRGKIWGEQGFAVGDCSILSLVRCHSARRPGARSMSCVRTADTETRTQWMLAQTGWTGVLWTGLDLTSTCVNCVVGMVHRTASSPLPARDYFLSSPVISTPPCASPCPSHPSSAASVPCLQQPLGLRTPRIPKWHHPEHHLCPGTRQESHHGERPGCRPSLSSFYGAPSSPVSSGWPPGTPRIGWGMPHHACIRGHMATRTHHPSIPSHPIHPPPSTPGGDPKLAAGRHVVALADQGPDPIHGIWTIPTASVQAAKVGRWPRLGDVRASRCTAPFLAH